LPAVGTKVGDLGISDSEFAERQKLARDIQEVLADNRLVQSPAIAGARRAVGKSIAAPASIPEAEEKEKDKADALRDYIQAGFDELSQRQNESARASTFAFNEPLDMKSEDAEQEVPQQQGLAGEFESSPGRSKRREQIALPESVQPAEKESIANLGIAGISSSTEKYGVMASATSRGLSSTRQRFCRTQLARNLRALHCRVWPT